ncbi:MAG: Holliday junction resolvase RuvX [Bacteroidota bacterium]|nr:Holliday junction resolvase RuvX [Bacteroidota bacterium]
MSRILSVDYGRKRVGIAVTDPARIIANGLTTVHAKDIFSFLDDYFSKKEVEIIVVGYPTDLKDRATDATEFVNPFIKKLVKRYPEKDIHTYDERFTSKLASMSILQSGLKKKARQNKALVDQVSATIILQSFMESIK